MQQFSEDPSASAVILTTLSLHLQVSNTMPHYVQVQNERKKGEITFMKLLSKSAAEGGENPTPSPSQQPPTCLDSGTNLRTSLVTARLLKHICLYCLVRNLISRHHMLPTQACHCNLACILLVCSISH